MILDAPSFEALSAFDADVCVVGSGPVGTTTALDLSARGARVLLLESGGRTPSAAAQALSAHENLRPENHHDPSIAVARRLGGTSNLWGGRCLPFDPLDFAARPWLDLPAWPIGPADLAPYEADACDYLDAGRPVWVDPLPQVAADGAFGWESLERWSNVYRVQVRHAAALAERANLLVALGTTALGFDYDAAGRIAAVEAHVEGAGRGRIPVRTVALCGGGVESARLLLVERRRRCDLFGGPDGPLGRHYMGHVGGRIADVAFEDAALHDGLDFHVDAHGSYVRRRLIPSPETQEAERLLNVAFWPVVPQANDPSHRSGPLSAAFLALSVGPLGRALLAEPIRRQIVGEPPHRRGAHLANVLRDPVRTVGAVPWYLWRSRLARMRLPGFFLTNRARRYGLEFHSEQLPRPDSRLTLSDAVDRLGQPLVRIDYRFDPEDAASVVRAHDAIEAWLVRNRLGRLIHSVPPEARAERVLAVARHGTHQIGVVRMGFDRRHAVVDRDCRAFDVPNLFVLSTAVLPTSSHANPTFLAVQLGLRFARGFAPTG